MSTNSKQTKIQGLNKNIKELMSEQKDSKEKILDSKLVESQYVDEPVKKQKEEHNGEEYGDDDDFEKDQDDNINAVFKQTQKKSELIEGYKKQQNKSQVSNKPPPKLNDKQFQERYYKMQDKQFQKKAHVEKLDEQLKKTKVQMAKTEHELSYVRRIGGHEKQEQIDIKQFNELENIKDENKKLKQKILAMNNQLKQPEQRKLYKAIGEEGKVNMTKDQQKVKDLVKLNEMLKKQLKQSEENCKRLQKMLNSKVQIVPNEVHEKNSKLVGIQARFEDLQRISEILRRDLDSQKAKVAELNAQNRDYKEELTDLRKENSLLSLSVQNAHEAEEDLRQVRKEKDKLEARLRELAVSPIFKDYDDRVNNRQQMSNLQEKLIQEEEQGKSLRKEKEDITREMSSLEQENKELKQQNQNLKITNAEQKAKLDKVDQQMAPFRELQKMDPDLYLKALGEVKYKSDKPNWNQYAQIDDTLNTFPQGEQAEQLQKQLQEAIYEKGQLAQQLKKSQTMLQTKMEIEREKDSLHKIEIQKLQYQLNATQSRVQELSKLADINRGALIKQDVKGEGESVFSLDDMTLQVDKDHNYLDLWLGQVDIYQSNLEYASYQKIKQKDAKDLKTFCIIDFFNHSTQNSGIQSGINPAFNCQFSFKVEQNEIFLEYLNEGSIKIELYGAVGTNAVKLGFIEVPLKRLYEENTSEQYSILVKEKMQIFARDDRHRDIASIEIRFKLRFSPYQSLQWLNTKKQGNQIQQKAKKQFKEDFNKELKVRERLLALVVIKAIGFPSSSQSFVYYQLKGQDYFSQTLPDENPSWNYHEVHNIQYDEQFVAFLKQEKLKFIIFDDSQGLHEGDSDILGTAELEAKELCKDTIIEAELDIFKEQKDRNNKKKIGKLFVKTFWMDTLSNKYETIEIGDDYNINDILERDIALKIAIAMQQRKLDLKSGFRIFDRDEDSVINFEDFSNTITQTLNMKLHPEEIEFYFKKLKQPFNELNFDNHFKKLLYQQRLRDSINDSSQKGQELSKYRSNQFNSPQVQRVKQRIEKIINQQLEQGSSIQSLFNDIDTSGEGYVDILEFQGWLLRYGVQEQNSDLQQFLKVIDRNNDKKINLTEFFEFILEDSRPFELEQMRVQRGGNQEKHFQNIQKAKEAILDYMATHKMTFQDIHQEIDKNRDGLVSVKEFREFLINILSQSIGPNYLHSLVATFDTNRDGKIDYNEFINEMQRMVRNYPDINKRRYYFSLFSGCKTQLTFATNQRVLIGIMNYLNQNQITIDNLFQSIDIDLNNRFNETELKFLLENKLQIILEVDQFQEFFEYLDEDRDGYININEWVHKLRLEIQQFQANRELKQSRQSKDHLNFLYKVLIKFVKEKGQQLFQQFQYNESLQDQVGQKKFTSILVDNFIELTNDEINSLIYSHLIPTDVNNDNVYYKQLLGKIDVNIIQDQSQIIKQQKRSQKLSREIFSKIKKIAQQKSMTNEYIFRKFDKDKSNTISKSELKQALRTMFELNDNEIEQIFDAIDVEKDGIIKFTEFKAVLNLDE